jgi:hypothetical protein
MKKKTRNAGSPHPAALGLQHLMRTVPADKRHEAMKELKRTTGMSKVNMLEHIGNRVRHGFEPKPPTEEEIEAQNRLAKLHM